jgi:hypothetical protein
MLMMTSSLQEELLFYLENSTSVLWTFCATRGYLSVEQTFQVVQPPLVPFWELIGTSQGIGPVFSLTDVQNATILDVVEGRAVLLQSAFGPPSLLFC